jgi:hypothetical protein
MPAAVRFKSASAHTAGGGSNMLSSVRISLAVLALTLPLAGTASAQDARADNTRLMCLSWAGTWKDFNPTFSHHQNRVNLYSNCMLENGLLP